MDAGGFLYIGPLYDLIFNLLVVLYRLAGENLGIALILIALISRLVLLPFTLRQLRNVDKNKEFQKKYEEVKSKFKNNKDQQTKELAKLQSQYLPGQLSGCLTLILQLVLLIQVNHVIRNLLKHGADAFNGVAYGFVDKFEQGYEFNINFVNGYLNLGKSASDVGVTNFSNSWPYLVIAVFLVTTQYFSMKFFTRGTPSVPKDEEKKKKGKGKGKDDEAPSFGQVFQDTNKQMMMFFPLILGFFSLNYPSGLSLYFATTSLFVIIQQGVMKRKEISEKFRKRFFVGVEEKDEELAQTEKSKSKPQTKTKKSKKRKRKLKKKN